MPGVDDVPQDIVLDDWVAVSLDTQQVPVRLCPRCEVAGALEVCWICGGPTEPVYVRPSVLPGGWRGLVELDELLVLP